MSTLREMKFHNPICMITTLNAVKDEIQELKQNDPDAKFSVETLVSVRSPHNTKEIDDPVLGTVNIPIFQCSNPSCGEKVYQKAGAPGWWTVSQR